MSTEAYLEHSPTLNKNVYIAPTASVIGKVTLGEDSSVWPMAVVRGDVNTIEIGERSNIQDGCVLHVTHDGQYSPGGQALVIGKDVTVGHKVTLHACTIEDETLIGIGSIVLDNAVVEKHALIGAGSLVPPGKIIEGGYLWMGSPVKKIRPLTDEEISFFKYSAEHYVRLKNDYSK